MSNAFLAIPPHRVWNGFLAEADRAGLFDWAVQNEAAFRTSTVRDKVVDLGIRNSLNIPIAEPWKTLISARITAFLPEIFAALRIDAFDPSRIELQLVAYNHGAFYGTHTDLRVRAPNLDSDRVISAVYYFHAARKAFEGGALRLRPIAPQTDAFVDIMPEQNTLLAFPSWAPHEVRPVECPSGRFEDSRFAINCWVRRARNPARTMQPDQ